MKQEIDPKTTSRAQAFEKWMQSPMPMVTLVKTFDVTQLVRLSRKKNLKFNMLLCWCIAKAASTIDEFYLLPEKPLTDSQVMGLVPLSAQCKLYRFDRMAVNVIVGNKAGGISTCDIPYSDSLQQFSTDYDALTRKAATTCQDITDEGAMIVGTSAVTGTELNCIVNQYTGIFNNPFLVWGRYKRHWLRTTLNVSFQFHHAQLDGTHAARFLEELQKTIKEMRNSASLNEK